MAANRSRPSGVSKSGMGSPPTLSQTADSVSAGEPILSILSHVPGNNAPIGGLKVIAENGWFAARPSGTENIYKIYVESFHGEQHLHRIADEAQAIVDSALAAGACGR